MLERLFDSWLGDVRQAVMDDLAWLALESAVYQKEPPGRPALEEPRQTTPGSSAAGHQTSRQDADGPESAGILYAGGPVEKRAGKAGPAGDPGTRACIGRCGPRDASGDGA